MLVYQALANAMNVINRDTTEDITDMWERIIEDIEANYLPSGGGFDCGSSLSVGESNENKLILKTEFHAMDAESGMYTHWETFEVTVEPSLMFGFTMDIKVFNQQNEALEDYVAESFEFALNADYEIKLNPNK